MAVVEKVEVVLRIAVLKRKPAVMQWRKTVSNPNPSHKPCFQTI
jgi:hypothetical protein